jgi:UDP-3-O-[3-hydroxymyristoyl] glucosamine N-acyltransferase
LLAYKVIMSRTVSEIAAILGLHFHGDGERRVERVSSWEAADPSSLVYIESRDAMSRFPDTIQAACVIVMPGSIPDGINVIFSEKPKVDFARAASLLKMRLPSTGLRHPSAVISPSAEIDESADVGPLVTIGPCARIRRGCSLQEGVVVGEGCVIGEECVLYPNVVLYPRVEVGNRTILHAGVVVGSDGFGYVFDGSAQIKFPQVGGVIIEDDVEIGANSTIDRGSLGITRIGAGSKIDNLVQVAHNVQIGRGVVIAAQTGISGSTVIEDYAVIGGQVGFGDHAHVQKGVVIGSKAGILPGKIVRSGETYWGIPVRPLSEYKRLNALFGRLPQMKEEISALKEKVAMLQDALQKLESKEE